MSAFNFSYDDSKVQEFGLIPDGMYECFIVASKVDKSSLKQTDFIEMKFKIREDVNQEHQNRTVFYKLFFTEKTEGMVHGFLKNIGTEQGTSFSSLQEIAEHVKGKSILAKVSTRKWSNPQTGESGESNEIKATKLSEIGGETTNLETAEPPNTNYNSTTRYDNDPFAKNGTTIDISDDELPF